VQLAKAFGAEVFATVSADKQYVAEEFGATTIDYRVLSTEQDVALHTENLGFDVVYDTVESLRSTSPSLPSSATPATS
jgi:NADPH2:quinone reductase